MPRSRTSRLVRRLRLLAIGLFVLALVLQPVLAAVGELHEITAHAILDHAHGDDAHHDGSDDTHDGDSPLHALVHVAHCCTQASTAALPACAGVLAPAPAAPLPVLTAGMRASAPDGDLFRPPITG